MLQPGTNSSELRRALPHGVDCYGVGSQSKPTCLYFEAVMLQRHFRRQSGHGGPALLRLVLLLLPTKPTPFRLGFVLRFGALVLSIAAAGALLFAAFALAIARSWRWSVPQAATPPASCQNRRVVRRFEWHPPRVCGGHAACYNTHEQYQPNTSEFPNGVTESRH